MRRLIAMIALTLVCPMGVALADPAPPAAALSTSSDDDCARARKAGRTCELVFSGDEVGGERITPGGEDIRVRKYREFGSLIRLRDSFRDRIIQSAENL